MAFSQVFMWAEDYNRPQIDQNGESTPAHKIQTLAEALDEFGYTDINPFERGAEWCDVTIRRYMLDGAIETALDEIADELK